MANPNNSFGTNGAYGGRTSVEAFNDVLSAFNDRGVLSGWKLAPAGGMSVNIGGDGENRDVAIAVDNTGNKTTVNNISKQPITVTIPAAPASGSRTDNIVAYINKPVQVDETTLDNPSAVNVLITSASSDSDIRSAITQDGGAGANAYYVILGSVNVASGTTDITSDMIEQGELVKIGSQNIDYKKPLFASYFTTMNSAVNIPSWGTGILLPGGDLTVNVEAGKKYKVGVKSTVRTNVDCSQVIIRFIDTDTNDDLSTGVTGQGVTKNIWHYALYESTYTAQTTKTLRIKTRITQSAAGAVQAINVYGFIQEV